MTPERNPNETRRRLLEAAFAEMHCHGYQGMRVDVVLEKTGLRKGAMYHHFSNKLALGHAVVDEVIAPYMERMWLDPLRSFDDPLQALTGIRDQFLADTSDEAMALGCPLNNLAQEMSPIEEGFRARIDALYRLWMGGIEEALAKGQSNGSIEPGLDSRQAAQFIVASVEGCLGLAKNRQSRAVFKSCSDSLGRYLLTLRPMSKAS